MQSRVDTNINNVATLFWFVSKLEIASFSIVTIPTKMFLTPKYDFLATSVIQIRDIRAEASTCMNCICMNKEKRISRMTSMFDVGLKNSTGQLGSSILCCILYAVWVEYHNVSFLRHSCPTPRKLSYDNWKIKTFCTWAMKSSMLSHNMSFFQLLLKR